MWMKHASACRPKFCILIVGFDYYTEVYAYAMYDKVTPVRIIKSQIDTSNHCGEGFLVGKIW